MTDLQRQRDRALEAILEVECILRRGDDWTPGQRRRLAGGRDFSVGEFRERLRQRIESGDPLHAPPRTNVLVEFLRRHPEAETLDLDQLVQYVSKCATDLAYALVAEVKQARTTEAEA